MGKWWEGYDWRLVQTNLREIDMTDISAEQYVRDLKEFHASVAMINAAGIISSYPTKIKYHYQSRFLTGDSLKDIITACHRENIKVIARTDFSKIRREIYEEHPTWVYRTAAGEIVDYEGDVHVCVNGAYQQEYMFEIVRECLTELDFDGIFFNMGGYRVNDYSGNYYGICHCDGCRRRFRERYGLALPAKEDWSDPVFRKYCLFKKETVNEHNERLFRFIKEIRPDILINHDMITHDTGIVRQEANSALDRPLPHWQYTGSENTKWVRGSYKNYISSNTTVDFVDIPTRHTAVSPILQETRLWQNLANTGCVDYYLIGRLDNHDDKSGYEGIKRAFAYHEGNQELYLNNESVADIAILKYERDRANNNADELRGLYKILTENHFLFDVVLINRATKVDLSKYKLLILPDLRNLSDSEAKAIDDFVFGGGKVLCTGQIGVLDEKMEEREAPVLSCVGNREHGLLQNARGAYFRLSDADRDIFPRFKNVNLAYIDGNYIYSSYNEQAESILKMIPPQPAGPPERCYALYPAGDNPGAVLTKHGNGRCVTMPWYPGALFHKQGYLNTSDFILDVIENVLGIKPVITSFPPMVEITLSKIVANNTHILHFVNQTGYFGNTFYPPIIIPCASCTIKFPHKPEQVISLVSRKNICFSYENGELTVKVNDIGLFEAIHIK